MAASRSFILARAAVIAMRFFLGASSSRPPHPHTHVRPRHKGPNQKAVLVTPREAPAWETVHVRGAVLDTVPEGAMLQTDQRNRAVVDHAGG